MYLFWKGEVHIGHGAVVSNCVFGPNVSVACRSVVDGCVISDSIINADSQVSHVLLKPTILGDSVQLQDGPRKMNVGDHSILDIG